MAANVYAHLQSLVEPECRQGHIVIVREIIGYLGKSLFRRAFLLETIA